jgi:hypothetical protein
MQFEEGQIRHVEPSFCLNPADADVRLMPGCFEQLTLGYRSAQELLDSDADVYIKPELTGLLSSMFPKGESFLRPL